MDNEITWDKLLAVRTSGRDASMANHINYPYEPTPYCVLERLAGTGLVSKRQTVLDYGCGKGRVDFYLAYQTRCHCIGIDYDERMVGAALENASTAVSGRRVQFIQSNASQYEVPGEVDICYFFNPFSVEVLRGALGRILASYYAQPRQITLLFYYPSDEYIACLMAQDELMFYDEIDCADQFAAEDPREKIVIFRIDG